MTFPAFPIASLPGLTWPVKRTVKQNTIMQDALSGQRLRFALYSYPIYAYELTFSFLRSDATQQWQTLQSFYNSVYGPQNVFTFDDANDDTVAAQEFGIGDGSTTQFQLVRTLAGWVEPVFCPETITVYKNGVASSAWSQSLGLVTFNSAPGAGVALTWSGTFAWPCRFDEDVAAFDNFAFQFFEMKSLKFSTEKFP